MEGDAPFSRCDMEPTRSGPREVRRVSSDCGWPELGRASGVTATATRFGEEEAPTQSGLRAVPLTGTLDLDVAVVDSAMEVNSGNLDVSSAWSRVVKEGRRLKHVSEDANPQPRPRLNQSRGKKPYGIVGTCPEGNIQAVKTKRVSVFATKFLPDLDAETLTKYLKEKLHHDVTCQKMDTAQNRYSSFKVTVECDKVEDVYEPQIWPHGVFVRRFLSHANPGQMQAQWM